MMTGIDDASEQAYADLADELNDDPLTYIGEVRPPLEDFDREIVERASQYAMEQGLPWPPEVGDFDRYCERKWNAR